MLISGIVSVLISVISFYFSAVLIVFALLFILLIVFLIIKRPKSVYILVSFFLLLSVTATLLTLSKAQKLSSLENQQTHAIFIVTDISYTKNNYHIADIKIRESDVLSKNTKLSAKFYEGYLEIGDCISGELKLEPLAKEYKKENYSKGIYLQASCRNIQKIPENNDKLLKAVDYLRSYIRKTLFTHMDYDEASIMLALCFGEKEYFTDEFYSLVTASGVNHVMAVSGMHLSILISFFLRLSEKFYYNRYIHAIISLFCVLLLSLLCGFTMSIIRAGVMYIITAIGLLLKRNPVSENTLGCAVFLILLFYPFAIFSLAFVLSSLSTFGILSIAQPILRYLSDIKIFKNRLFNYTVSNILISVSATIMVLPALILKFGFFSVLGIITTFLLAAPVTAVIWLCVTALIINTIFPLFADIIFFICEMGLKYIKFIIDFFGNLSFSVLETPKYTAIAVFVFIIVIFYLLLACKKRIDMLKLKAVQKKIIKEGGRKLKWQ